MEKLFNEELLKDLVMNKDNEEEVALVHLVSNYMNYSAYIVYAIYSDDKYHLFGYQSIGGYYSKGEILSLDNINEINDSYQSKGITIFEIDKKFRKTKIKTLKKNCKVIENN